MANYSFKVGQEPTEPNEKDFVLIHVSKKNLDDAKSLLNNLQSAIKNIESDTNVAGVSFLSSGCVNTFQDIGIDSNRPLTPEDRAWAEKVANEYLIRKSQ